MVVTNDYKIVKSSNSDTPTSRVDMYKQFLGCNLVEAV